MLGGCGRGDLRPARLRPPLLDAEPEREHPVEDDPAAGLPVDLEIVALIEQPLDAGLTTLVSTR